MSVPPPLPPVPRHSSHTSAEAESDKRGVNTSNYWPVVAALLVIIALILLLTVGVGIWRQVAQDLLQPSAAVGSHANEGSGAQPQDDADASSHQAGSKSEADGNDASAPAPLPDSSPSKPSEIAEQAPAPPQSPVNGPPTTISGEIAKKGRSVTTGSFFGVQAQGQRFVYVIDSSGSMDGGPLARAKDELFASLKALSLTQEFFIIFYDSSTYPMYYPDAVDDFAVATDDALTQVKRWLPSIVANDGTNPAPALLQALAMRPDAIFFLTDGAIPSEVPEVIATANTAKVSINAIGFMNAAGAPVLRQIARENDGTYRFVP